MGSTVMVRFRHGLYANRTDIDGTSGVGADAPAVGFDSDHARGGRPDRYDAARRSQTASPAVPCGSADAN